MKRLILFLLVCSVASASSTASASVIAYWRFDDVGDAEIDNPAGTVAAGNALPDSDGQTVWRKAAHDHSGNGNHLTTWDHGWAGFNWTADVPSATVPLTGASNKLSMQNAGGLPAAMTWSEQSLPSGVNIETMTPAAFTIEASFKADSLGGHRTIVGRDDQYVATTNGNLAALYFQTTPGNQVAFKFADLDGYWHELISDPDTVTTGQWYNMVGVSDGSTMSLYLDNKLLKQVDLTLSGSANTALALGTASGGDWESGTWSVARGLYAGGHADRWMGLIDEVRISDNALNPSEFLQVPLKAGNPFPPSDGRMLDADSVALMWDPGLYAVWHDVYFSDNFDDVNTATTASGGVYKDRQSETKYPPGPFETMPVTRGETYYWRIDEVNDSHPDKLWRGDVWSFTVVSDLNYDPNPPHQDTFVAVTTDLSWSKGALALDGHIIYLSTDFSAVDSVAPGTMSGPAYLGFTSLPTTTTIAIPGDLAYNTTYYWRADVVEKNAPLTVHKGDVWEFETTVPGTGFILREIWQNITPTGTAISLLYDWPDFPHNPTIRGMLTGFATDPDWDEYGGRIHGWVYAPVSGDYTFHLTTDDNGQLWLSTDEDPANAQLIASESSYRTLYDWASSGEEASVPITLVGGNKYYISALWKEGAGGDHCAVGWKVPGATSPTVIAGRYLTPYVWYRAYDPLPPDESSDVERTLMLSWEAGADAAAVNGHKLYFGADRDPVITRTVAEITCTDPCYPIATTLDWGQTYYWAVDEVNGLDVWPGDLWSFTTINYLLVDDMEKYTPNVPNPNIFQVWVDGSGDCVSIAGNNTGATVDIELATYLGGLQAMKLQYDNDGTVFNPCTAIEEPGRLLYSKSEAQVSQLPSGIGSDWTLGGAAKALSLRFYGTTGNALDPLWVQLTDASNNKAKVFYGTYVDEDIADMNEASWHEWLIDLADFTPVNVGNVKSIAIGIGNEGGSAGGAGVLYFDDIKLYTPRCVLTRRSADFAKLDYAPETSGGDCKLDYRELEIMSRDWMQYDYNIDPVAPDPAGLKAWYQFENNANDSSPNANHGTENGFPLYVAGRPGYGQAISLDGTDDYVSLPIGSQIASLGSCSFVSWVDFSNLGDAWQRIFDFGSGTDSYLFLSPRIGTEGAIRFAIKPSGAGEQIVDTSTWLASGWHHIAVTIDADNTTANVYLDGTVIGANTAVTLTPSDVGATTQNWLGRSQYAADGYYNGLLDDFRIYNYALSHGEILSTAGMGTLYVAVTSPSNVYDLEPATQKKVNFKDYAKLVLMWLEENEWP
ncbi:MAG: hypothetical protein KAY65_09680 [Planctomycetes bacterium]|nr:hypothetical protein [Planctomycetota bacterium]